MVFGFIVGRYSGWNRKAEYNFNKCKWFVCLFVCFNAVNIDPEIDLNSLLFYGISQVVCCLGSELI